MAKIGRELLDRLSNEGVQGPFVTIMINTNVTPQGVEKDQLKIKNFMKEAKKNALINVIQTKIGNHSKKNLTIY